MNFLILTPDGVGSTYLQRALTIYLNTSGHEYFNTHFTNSTTKLTNKMPTPNVPM